MNFANLLVRLRLRLRDHRHGFGYTWYHPNRAQKTARRDLCPK